MVGHDSEAVELEFFLLAIAQERFEEEFCVGFLLEMTMLKEGRDGDGVGVALLGHHVEEHTLGLKPSLLLKL